MTTKNNLAEAVVIERTFNAPVAKVWNAITDAEEMRQWYFDLKEFKPEVGFEFEFVVIETVFVQIGTLFENNDLKPHGGKLLRHHATGTSRPDDDEVDCCFVLELDHG